MRERSLFAIVFSRHRCGYAWRNRRLVASRRRDGASHGPRPDVFCHDPGPASPCARLLRLYVSGALLVVVALFTCMSAPAVALAGQTGTVGWSDGSRWGGTFVVDQAVYLSRVYVPKVIVRLAPTRPSRMVVLEYKSAGRWRPESTARTVRGVARLALDPRCEGGQWCDGTFVYRVRVVAGGGQRALLSAHTNVLFRSGVAPPVVSPFEGCMFRGNRLWGNIFVVDYAWEADVKVFQVDYEWEADLKVKTEDYSWAATSCGQWHFVDYSWEADTKIFFVDYSWEADVKVVSVSFGPGLP